MTKPTQAQVAAAKRAYWDAWDKSDNNDVCLVAALTAAAGVGETKPETEYAEGTIGWSMAVKKLQDNATIERCAQVAAGMNVYSTPWETAAAIRALKDKP
jgi:hypothetical protein